ncbi:MAG: hypothetical protein JNL45_10305 [Hyphomicrobium sp.]|jgi:hypothetical protein|nr:hypothetical protein [Hyphomicrobium sp.]
MVAYWFARDSGPIAGASALLARLVQRVAASVSNMAAAVRFDPAAAVSHLDLFHGDQISGMSSAAMFRFSPCAHTDRAKMQDGAAVVDPSRVPTGTQPMGAEAHAARMPLGAAVARWQDLDGQIARVPLTYEAGIVVALAVAALLALRMGDTPARGASRNAAAETIAEQFASASDETDIIEERFAFARRFRVIAAPSRWFSDTEHAGLGQPDESNEDAAPVGLPFDSLGAIVIRGLPAGTQLTAGRRIGTAWILAPGDLAGMDVIVPAGGVSALARARIEVFDQAGVYMGALAIGLREAEGPGIALGALRGKEGLDWIGAAAGRFSAPNGDIRTGALNLPRQATAADAETAEPSKSQVHPKRAQRRAHSALRPAQARRPKARGTSTATAVSPAATGNTGIAKGGVPAKPAPLPPLFQLKPDAPLPILLFKPAGSQPGADAAPAIVTPFSSLIQLGVFPRSPMEEEAARRE